MSQIERRLEKLIDDAGIRIVETGRLSSDLNACYHEPSQTIVIRWGLDPVTRRCAIAHELGHAYYGHDCSSQRAEREADEWAAKQLLTVDMVETAGASCDGAPSLIASELGVTPGLLSTWMRMYEAGRILGTYEWCSIS